MEAKIVNPDYLIDYLESIKEMLNKISTAKSKVSLETKKNIRNLEENIKKLSGLTNEEDDNDVDQDEVEALYQQWINKPTEDGSLKSSRNFNDLRSRIDYARLNNLVYNNSAKTWAAASSVSGKVQLLTKAIDNFSKRNPELSWLSTELMSIISDIETLKSQTFDLGTVDSPVGYVNKNGLYELDPNYLSKVNDALKKFRELQSTLQDELKPLLSSDINRSIRNLSSIKEKYLKNRMIDFILQVITDENNKFRMMTPISFDPLTKAIEKIPTALIPSTKYDLSSATELFLAYQSLTSGMVLTGAFANASKSFGYFSRAGASKKINDYYKLLADAKSAMLSESIPDESVYQALYDKYLEFNPSFEKSEVSKKAYLDLYKSIASINTEVNKSSSRINTAPTLNPMYQFTIKLEDKKFLADRLVTRDFRNEFSVTAVYDALTNEAIDNLKLGDLVKSRINPNTGSMVIGLVSLGVPMDFIVKLLYQPIFAPLVTGKVNRVDTWLSDLISKNKNLLTNINYDAVDIAELDKFLKPEYHKFQNSSDLANQLTSSEWMMQLKALNLFAKGYKIGEDMRAASTFLDLIRTHDVFIEDILQLDDDLSNKIGKVDKVGDELVLAVNPDFAYIIPNLFSTAPHLKEAYLAHEDVKNIISNNIKIHSKKAVEFSELVYQDASILKKEEGEKAQTSKANIRRSLSHYLLAGLVDVNSLDIPDQTIQINNYRIKLSKLRAYSNNIAEKVWKLKEFADKDNNYFLKNISIIRDSYSVSSISFKSGVNLNPEDIRNITLGFKLLNSYGFDENNNPIRLTVTNPNQISEIQKDLLNYAILNYGLQFSNSNFSNYINSVMLREVDQQYNIELDKMLSTDSNSLNNIVQHFILSHMLQNASRLPYLDFSLLVPSVPSTPDSPAIYPGKENNIYFDLRYKKVDEAGNSVDMPRFIKDKFKSNTIVYIRVATNNTYAYYQKVIKVSDAFHKKLDLPSYSLDKYFNPNIANIDYQDISENKLTTTSKSVSVISPEDIIFVYPSHNADRTEGRKVKVVSIIPATLIKGTIITFKEISSVDEMIESGEVTKICKI